MFLLFLDNYVGCLNLLLLIWGFLENLFIHIRSSLEKLLYMVKHLLNQAIVSRTCNNSFVLKVVETICNTLTDVVCIFYIIN